METPTINNYPKGTVELLNELDNIEKLFINDDSKLDDDEWKRLDSRRLELIDNYDWSDQVFEENGKVGIKSVFGDVLVPAKFDGIVGLLSCFNSYVSMPIVLDGKDVLVKRDGTGTVISEKYDEIRKFMYYFLYRFKKDGKYGALTMEGEVVLEDCDEVLVCEPNPYVLFKKNGKYGVYNFEKATEAIFDDVEFDADGPINVVMNGQRGHILEDGSFTDDEYEENLWYNNGAE